MNTQDLEKRVGRLEKTVSGFSQELRLALRYIQPDAASSLTKSRVVLERLLISVYTSEMGREPRKPLLAEMLADNQFTRKIERRILSRMNAVRDMGNLGPHGEPVEPADAARVLDDLCEVLDWYVGRTARLNRGATPLSHAPSGRQRAARWLGGAIAILVLAILGGSFAALGLLPRFTNDDPQAHAKDRSTTSSVIHVVDKPTMKEPSTDEQPQDEQPKVEPTPRTLALDLGGGVKLECVRIEAGSFDMGSTSGDLWEKPVHKVTISKPFYMGRYEVTVGQFRRFVESNPGYRTEAELDPLGAFGVEGNTLRQNPKFSWRNPGFHQTEQHPVVNVSYNDACRFCEWLTQASGKQVFLPWEAQWEYACRAGSKSLFSFGDDPNQIGNYAWYIENSSQPFGTHPCGQKKPNAWDLYDMHGNVWEWCRDGMTDYRDEPITDPKSSDGSLRMTRGGGFAETFHRCRSAARYCPELQLRSISLGFRIVVTE